MTKSKSVLFSDCPTDHPDTNSTGVKVTSTKIGTVLTYTCNSDPSITLTSKCRGDGTWTSSASSCTVSMPDLPGILDQFKSFYDILLCNFVQNWPISRSSLNHVLITVIYETSIFTIDLYSLTIVGNKEKEKKNLKSLFSLILGYIGHYFFN